MSILGSHTYGFSKKYIAALLMERSWFALHYLDNIMEQRREYLKALVRGDCEAATTWPRVGRIKSLP